MKGRRGNRNSSVTKEGKNDQGTPYSALRRERLLKKEDSHENEDEGVPKANTEITKKAYEVYANVGKKAKRHDTETPWWRLLGTPPRGGKMKLTNQQGEKRGDGLKQNDMGTTRGHGRVSSRNEDQKGDLR